MKINKNVGSVLGSMARYVIPALSFVTPVCFANVSSDGQTPEIFRSEVSRSAVTTMPAFTVDENQSAKTHTLFMGADIALNLDKDMYSVRDVWGSNWVIEINGREREVSANRAPLNLKITPNLKLTENSATIVAFKRVQSYSYANDPSVMLTKGLSQSASMSSDLMAAASNAQARVDTMLSNNMSGAGVFAGADDQFSANAMLLTAQYEYANLHTTGLGTFHAYPLPSPTAPTATTDTTGALAIELERFRGPDFPIPTKYINTGYAETVANTSGAQTDNNNEPGKLATSGLDAMDVEFDIRSAKPLHNPYVVTMTRFHARNSRPGMVQNMVYAQSLHPIDEHLSHVHFIEEGFPFDYELIDFQLHIYNRGEEIATNVAADRVELTRDEAFEYVRSEYIGAHPKDTLPATPAMAKLPADLPAKLAQKKYSAAFYVKVSKDGIADEAYSDPACTQRIKDPYLDSVVKRVRFKPALSNGRPVEGIATVNLGQLAI
jgi:hypothetical protein